MGFAYVENEHRLQIYPPSAHLALDIWAVVSWLLHVIYCGKKNISTHMRKRMYTNRYVFSFMGCVEQQFTRMGGIAGDKEIAFIRQCYASLSRCVCECTMCASKCTLCIFWTLFNKMQSEFLKKCMEQMEREGERAFANKFMCMTSNKVNSMKANAKCSASNSVFLLLLSTSLLLLLLNASKRWHHMSFDRKRRLYSFICISTFNIYM